jgi:hypothetical protein
VAGVREYIGNLQALINCLCNSKKKDKVYFKAFAIF